MIDALDTRTDFAGAKTVDRFRNRLALSLVVSFMAALGSLLIWDMPTGNKDIIVYMVGQLSGMATTALGFYFVNKAGQDALDVKRTENTGKLADAVVAAANAVPPAEDRAKGGGDAGA